MTRNTRSHSMRAEETNENCLTSTAVATIPRSTESQLNCLNVGSGLNPNVFPTLRLRLEQSSDLKGGQVDANCPTAVTHQQPRQVVAQSTRSSSDNCWLETQPNSLRRHRLTFDQWLLSKKKQELVRRCQFRRELQQQKQVRQVRRQMSDQCYADWLHLKRRRRVKASTTMAAAAALIASTSEQRDRCLRQWEQRKQHESRQRREQQLRKKEQQRMDERVREQLSQLAWQRWLAQLAVKSLKPRFATGQPGKARSSAGGAASPVLTQQQRRKLQQQLASVTFRMPLSAAQRALRTRHF